MFFGSKKVIGIDIGSSSIKLAELEQSRGKWELQSFGFIPTPEHSMNGGEITDVKRIAATIKHLVNQVKTKRKTVATSLWGTAVIVKKISIAKVDKKVLDEHIRFEAEQYIPFELSQVNLSYHILPTSVDPQSLDILLVAAQSDSTNHYIQSIKSAGLDCQILDVGGLALANCFEANYGKPTGEAIGLFNFGARVTNFVAISQGEVIFCRDIPVGGANYTNEIHRLLQVTPAEAEALKMSAVAGHDVPDDVHSVMSATNDLIIEEIRNTIDFLGASANGIALSRCYYIGGSSVTTGLVQGLSSATGLYFEAMNPFLKVSATKSFTPEYLQQISPYVGIVLGLAMRVGDQS